MTRLPWMAVCLLALTTGTAEAQIGVKAHVAYDTSSLDPAQSLDAVTGDNRTTGVTFGASVLRIWRGVFADVAFGRRTLEGTRVFRHAGQTFDLGIPMSVEWRPLDVAAGWRFETGRVAPYVGLGFSAIAYKERSDFSAAGDDVSDSARGLLLLAGADVAVTRWLGVGAEVRRRSVEGVIGQGGVSEEFGERGIGGTTVAVRVSIGR